MDILSELLNKISENFENEILQFYERFYSYTLDLIKHKNIDFTKQIRNDDEDIQVLIKSINSALNTTGIPITELSNQEILKGLFKDALNDGNSNFQHLFDKVGKDFINKHLFRSILEYLIDIDTIKIENLDLFDLLPSNFKYKLDEFKRSLSISDNDKKRMKSLISTINSKFNASALKFKYESINNSDDGTIILKKLQEAKENNIQALKNPQFREQFTESVDTQEVSKSKKEFFYFNHFGNFPLLDYKKIQSINVDIDQFSKIITNIDLLMDLENLFYFTSISKMLGLNNLIQPEKFIPIIKNFIRGSIFSSGMYHISNPVSNFYGLCILSELNILDEGKIEFVDFLDVEMFLESEIKNFIPSKFFLNFYTFLSLKILENHDFTILNKSNLLHLQSSLNFSNVDPKELPLEILCHLTLIKLMKGDFKIDKDFLNLNFNNLLSPNGLINNNITDSVRVLLIFDLLDWMHDDLPTKLMNAILSNFQAFFEIYPQFDWKSDILALKTELRMLFWFCLALLRF